MENGILKTWLYKLLLLMGNTQGCGDDDDPPEYKPSSSTTQLEQALVPKASELAGKSYEDWIKRFAPSEEINAAFKGITDKYEALFEGQDYSTQDFKKTEDEYLDTVLRKFTEARGEAFKPVQEGLIAENLFESGPGFGMQTEFGEGTAEGVGDITKQWAYEGIQRKMQQRQYTDALKRGDYSTMYNLALSEANRAALPAQQATQAEFGAIGQGTGLFGQLQAADLNKYNAAMQSYGLDTQSGGDLGGAGMGLGGAAMAALAMALPGGQAALIPYAMMAGGGLGSMFRT